MSGRISISGRSAQTIKAMMDDHSGSITPTELRALDELVDALKRRPKKSWSTGSTKPARRAAKKETARAIRGAVVLRDGDCCCACERSAVVFTDGLQMDHFFGRARAESVETCWLLCFYCHRDKTDNSPSARWWLERFMNHARQYGYAAEAAKAQARLDSLSLVKQAQEVGQ